MAIYNYEASRLLIGCLLKQPNLLVAEKCSPLLGDFEPVKFHKIMIEAIVELYNSGVNDIDYISMSQYLDSCDEEIREVAKDNKYDEFIELTKEISNVENVEAYFNSVRKMTVLRVYHNSGFDITKIYDEAKEDYSKVDSMTVEEIFDYFESKQVKIRKKLQVKAKNKSKRAGVGFKEIKDRFKETPYFGQMLPSAYLTTLQRGACSGHLNLASGGSGSGKTITSSYEMVFLCAKELWSEEKGCYVKNPNRIGAGLFINTEMDLETEFEPMLVAGISLVDRKKIIDGTYDSPEEEARVDRAIEILEESEIYLEDMPDFTLIKLEQCIKEYKLNYNITNVCFDYIQDNGEVGKEMNTGSQLRGDVVLLHLSDALKIMARRYEVNIRSGTQLNGKQKINEIIDEDCLAGGKATKNKCDNCYIMLPLRKKEIEIAEMLEDRKGFGSRRRINRICHVFKSRFSPYGDGIKVWVHIDLGTGKIYDIATTDNYNNPIKINKTLIDDEIIVDNEI